MKIYLIRHGESLANLGLVSADFSMDNQNTLSKKGEKSDTGNYTGLPEL